jgi:hypothetical protein
MTPGRVALISSERRKQHLTSGALGKLRHIRIVVKSRRVLNFALSLAQLAVALQRLFSSEKILRVHFVVSLRQRAKRRI